MEIYQRNPKRNTRLAKNKHFRKWFWVMTMNIKFLKKRKTVHFHQKRAKLKMSTLKQDLWKLNSHRKARLIFQKQLQKKLSAFVNLLNILKRIDTLIALVMFRLINQARVYLDHNLLTEDRFKSHPKNQVVKII